MLCCVRICPVPLQVLQVTGSVPGFAPEPWQFSARFLARDFNLFFNPERRFFKRDGQVVTQIVARDRAVARLSAAKAAESAAEHLPKNIAKVAKPAESPASERVLPAHARIERRVAILVILCAFVRVGKNFRRFVEFLKLCFLGFVAGMQVGVALLRFLLRNALLISLSVAVLPTPNIS